MKPGTENRNKVIAASALGVLAVVLLGRMVFSFSGSAPANAAPPAAVAEEPPAATPPVRGAKKPAALMSSMDPTLRFDWLRASEDTKYLGAGRNIFREQADIPKPVQRPVMARAPVVAPQPTGPPPPPPINLRFFGFASQPGQTKKIFLSEGDDVFIAQEGEIIDRRYKVIRISPMSVEIEDVLNSNRQIIPLTAG